MKIKYLRSMGYSWNSAEKEIYIKVYIRKENKSEINNVSFHVKNLKNEQTQSKTKEDHEDQQ